jgi:hypothetical protein
MDQGYACMNVNTLRQPQDSSLALICIAIITLPRPQGALASSQGMKGCNTGGSSSAPFRSLYSIVGGYLCNQCRGPISERRIPPYYRAL